MDKGFEQALIQGLEQVVAGPSPEVTAPPSEIPTVSTEPEPPKPDEIPLIPIEKKEEKPKKEEETAETTTTEESERPKAQEIPDEQIVRLVVDGQIIERPWGELRRDAQKYFAADKRLREAAEQAKAIEQQKIELEGQLAQLKEVHQELLRDPLKAAESLLTGVLGSQDRARALLKELTIEWLDQTIREAQMSPEEKERLREKRRIEEEHAKLQQQHREALEKARKAQEEAARQQALEQCRLGARANKLPETETIIRQIALELATAIRTGVPLTPEEAGRIVKENRQRQLRTYLEQSSRSAKELIQAFPEAEAEIQRHFAARSGSREPTEREAARPQAPTPQVRRPPERPLSVREWRQMVESL